MPEVNKYIKYSKKLIHIQPLVGLIFIVAFVVHYLKELVILYSIVMIHEFFHLAAARYLKVNIEAIKIMPFGVTLKIKNNYIKKPEHEIIIACAGPFSNLLMIVAAYILKVYYLYDTDDMTFFIFANFIIGGANLVPAVPLDGGRILKAVLTLHWGFVRAFNFTIYITKVICLLSFVAGAYILYITGLNSSILMISIFLIFNIVNEQNNNNLAMMKEIVYCKEKLLEAGFFNAKSLVVICNLPAQKLLKNFSYNHFYLITVIDNKMNIIGTLTEAQVIDGLVELGAQVTIEEVLINNQS
ncbi:MAG: site-2 protease family protein [Clostridia bacterium]